VEDRTEGGEDHDVTDKRTECFAGAGRHGLLGRLQQARRADNLSQPVDP